MTERWNGVTSGYRSLVYIALNFIIKSDFDIRIYALNLSDLIVCDSFKDWDQLRIWRRIFNGALEEATEKVMCLGRQLFRFHMVSLYRITYTRRNHIRGGERMKGVSS